MRATKATDIPQPPAENKEQRREQFTKRLHLLSTSGVGVLMIRTREPYRAQDALMEYALVNGKEFRTWNLVQGWREYKAQAAPPGPGLYPKDTQAQPLMALAMVSKWPDGINVMFDLYHNLKPANLSAQLTRALSGCVRDFSQSKQRLALIVPEGFTLPIELKNDIPLMDFDLPSALELREVLLGVMDSGRPKGDTRDVSQIYDEAEIQSLTENASGLTEMEAESAMAQALIIHSAPWKTGKIPARDFSQVILSSKTEIIKQSGVLELIPAVSRDMIGGLDLLMSYAEGIAQCFSVAAKAFGADRPTGITLCGPPGCLSGDTKLLVKRGKRNSGREITLEEFYKKFNGLPATTRPYTKDADCYIHSFNSTNGTVFYNRVLSVIDSGDKPCLRLTTEGGNVLTLTYDHPVMSEEGIFVKAGELSAGRKILLKGSMKPQPHESTLGRQERVTIEGLSENYPSGWAKVVFDKKTGNTYHYRRNHRARLVVESQMNGLSYKDYVCVITDPLRAASVKVLEEGIHIHHIDENAMNDTPDNLMVLLKAQHDALHNDEKKFNVEYVKSETISSIEPAGIVKTYDIQMEFPCNNFVASGIIVHNTGKTLGAKVIAFVLGIPFAIFHIRRVRGKYVGDSEHQMASALSTISAMGRAVICIDEVDRQGTASGGGDNGVSDGITSALLTHIQEHNNDGTYWVFTGNRPSKIDPALLRQGRMDDIFAIMPPNDEERREIFGIHLRKRSQSLDALGKKGVDEIVAASQGHVSAELEGAVKGEVWAALLGKRKVSAAGIITQLQSRKPLCEAFPDDFLEMAEWAESNARPSSSDSTRQSVKNMMRAATAIETKKRRRNNIG